jgi:hypothetical protein
MTFQIQKTVSKIISFINNYTFYKTMPSECTRRHNRRSRRIIRPTPVIEINNDDDDNKENNIPFGTSPPSENIQRLDSVFHRVIKAEHLLTPTQKTYMEEQIEAFDDEKYILQRIVGDLREGLNSIHNYEIRHQPDQHVPLFFDKEYQNFKLRMEVNELFTMLSDKSSLFSYDLSEDEDSIAAVHVDNDDGALQDIQMYAI